MAILTLIAIGVALFGETFRKWLTRPKIKVLFKPSETDFYHKTTMEISTPNGISTSIPTYYIRLKVQNTGIDTLKNVEVVLENVIPRTKKPFMSLNLNWAGFITAPHDITRTVNIPQGEARTLDVFEFMEFPSARIFFDELRQLNVSDAIRYEELSKGFRSCTIKPLTRSDIFPRGSYKFKLAIYADNVKPKFLNISIKYKGNWTDKTSDQDMRNKYLKVSVS